MKTTDQKTTKTNSTLKTIVLVSIIWVGIGATVFAFMQNAQAQYNRGLFDGMQKTKVILQSK